MHPDLVRARTDHAAATQGWLALVGDLSAAQANWRPGSERWSVAQCLDHVHIVTGAVLPALRAAVVGAREDGQTASGLGPFRYGRLSRWFLAAQAPSRGRATRTPARYRPSASEIDLAGVVASFSEVQERFDAAMQAADGVDLARVRVPSPALAWLRFPVGIWFQALPVHGLRHLAQARQLRENARFPSA